MFEHQCLNIVICSVKIEEAIKQTKPFKSPYERLVVNMMYTNNWIAEQIGGLYKEFGITEKQYNILRILKGAGKPVSTSYIRERMINKMSDVSRLVDRMFAKGLVEKNGCPNDKRLVDVLLTEKALELLETVNKKNEEINKVLNGLNEGEVNQLNGLLDKLRKN